MTIKITTQYTNKVYQLSMSTKYAKLVCQLTKAILRRKISILLNNIQIALTPPQFTRSCTWIRPEFGLKGIRTKVQCSAESTDAVLHYTAQVYCSKPLQQGTALSHCSTLTPPSSTRISKWKIILESTTSTAACTSTS